MIDVRALYRENAARGASPVGRVILLYEQIVEDLRRAEKAIEEGNIEARTNAINHALTVLGHLQGKLDMQAGGKVADNLHNFYNLSRQRLLEAQWQASEEVLKEQISLLLDLRDAWVHVDQTERTPAVSPAAADTAKPNAENRGADWRG